ncbi:MAG: large subunit ribosomal protein [Baekduia sp.]|jgi:large subunit ribosomal protein L25|nr:ribosomal protein [Conexibacter sp.]MDX6716591.1 large subunit ribosomal protein [Baekduia sp.]MDX6732679.1 large subunit ribosomal protein [Baekduia sp.]
MADQTTTLDVHARGAAHSRETRRLRRSGQVPGVLYGGTGEPLAFAVAARTLRHALAAKGAVLELSIDGGPGTPAVLKDSQRHPVRGEIMHVDLLRVDLTVEIEATVPVVLVNFEQAPGIVEGGILEHVTRELTIQALPNDIPESIEVDVSGMEMNATIQLSAITAPAGITLLDDPDATVLASITPPSVSTESGDEVETETERVGEKPKAEAAADASSGDGSAE